MLTVSYHSDLTNDTYSDIGTAVSREKCYIEELIKKHAQLNSILEVYRLAQDMVKTIDTYSYLSGNDGEKFTRRLNQIVEDSFNLAPELAEAAAAVVSKEEQEGFKLGEGEVNVKFTKPYEPRITASL